MKRTKMSQLRDKRLNGFQRSRLIIFLLICLCSVASNGVSGQQQTGQQQPIRQVLPVGQELHQIPAAMPMQAPQLNTTSEIASGFSSGTPRPRVERAIHPGVMVRQASNDDVDAYNHVRRNSRMSHPKQSEFPWEYQLQHQSYAQFERKLADIWGDRLLCDSLDSEHRMLRIFLPAGNTAPEAPMRFDRVRGVLTYEGAPNRKQGWHQLIQALDRPDSRKNEVAVAVIDVGSVDQNVVQQASWYVQDAQDDSRAPNNQDQQAIDVIQGPGDLDLSQDVLDRLEQDVPNLKGTVELRELPETGALIIIGEEEDVAKVKAYMLKVIAAAKTMSPRTASIPLFNSQPTELAGIVQEVYDNQFQALHGPVDIRPIAASNSLFVAGSEGALAAVATIVKQFDGEKPEVIPPDVQLTESEKGYLFYQLKHISATTAKRVVDEFFGQATNVQPNAPREPFPVITIVESRSNTLSILAGLDLRNKAKAFLDEIDTPNNNFERVIQVFPIRNQIAGDLALIVQDILNGGQQLNIGITETQGNLGTQTFNPQQQQPGSTLPITPITTLQIRARDNSVVDGGILFDARLTSNNASNTIAVVAPEHAMGLIAELIKQLDKLPDVESVVKVFPIINGDAREILSTLQEIFGQGQQGQQGAQQQQGATANLPLQSAAGSDGSTLLNLTFAVNDRTNTIIASGSQTDLDFVESLIQRLDEEDINDRETWIYRLSNAFVLDVATALDDFLTTRQTILSTNPLAGGGQFNGGVNLSRREVIVVPDASSNSLIINARRNEFPVIEHIIKGLDRLPPMVKVKAMIVSVDLDQLEEFGVEFGIQDSSIFEAGLSDTIGTGFVGLDNVAGQLETNLGVGRGLPGFVLSAGDESLNFLLRFLKQKGCANVLFSPQIMTLENLEARLNVGAQIQRLGAATTTVGAGVTQSIENVDTGITLAVTPRVMPDGMIVMFVDVQNSALGSEANGTTIGIDANGNEIRSAPINQTAAQTAIMCRSGQTVALSGLISENKSQLITSVPILGDLPVVGPLFQSVRNSANRSEMLIILTPYIVDGPDDINALNEDDFNRMHWCKCDVAEIYGTTSYSGSPYFEQTPKIYYPDNDPTASNPQSNPQSRPQPGFQSETLPSLQNGFNQSDAGIRPVEQTFPQNRNWQNYNRSGIQNGNPLMHGGSREDPTGDPRLDGSSSRNRLPDGQYNQHQIQPDFGAVSGYRTQEEYQQAGNGYPREVQYTKQRAIAPPSPYSQQMSQQLSQVQNAQMAARFLEQYRQEKSQFVNRAQFQPPAQGQPVGSNYRTANSHQNSHFSNGQDDRYGGVSNSYR